MALYSGRISGVGNATTRINEITADDLAIIRHFILGYNSGVIDGLLEAHTETEVTIKKGLCFAYGYVGYNEKEAKFNFNRPSAVQYHFIYAEIDLSVVPNTFKVKVKNNQGGSSIKPYMFRQDILSSIRTGVYQIPLYKVKLDSSGIAEIVDLRNITAYMRRVHESNITKQVSGRIDGEATGTTQTASDNSKKIATTMFCHNAIRDYIDNNGGTVSGT